MTLKDENKQHAYIYNGASQRTKQTRTNTINYVYDGMMVVQMRGASTSSYTRGLDLSQSLQGAGGIGGLLAQAASGAHSYYHSDGNGNVTYLMKADQSLGASYRYDDAYGNVVTTSGTLSNPFRFSNKEWLPRIGCYYYGYRFYYPSIQRWLNRDPIGEEGGINLYEYVGNDPLNYFDPDGNIDASVAIGVSYGFDLAVLAAELGPTVAFWGGYGLGYLIDETTGFSDWLGPKIGNWWVPPLGPTVCETKNWEHNNPNPWTHYRPKDPNDPTKGGLRKDPNGNERPVPRPSGPPPKNHPNW